MIWLCTEEKYVYRWVKNFHEVIKSQLFGMKLQKARMGQGLWET